MTHETGCYQCYLMIFQSHPVFGIPQNLRQISQGFPPKKCHLSQPITGPGRRTTATQRPERWESPGTYSKLGGSCLENMVAPWQRYEKHRKTIGKQWGDSEISTISSMVLVYLPKKWVILFGQMLVNIPHMEHMIGYCEISDIFVGEFMGDLLG